MQRNFQGELPKLLVVEDTRGVVSHVDLFDGADGSLVQEVVDRSATSAKDHKKSEKTLVHLKRPFFTGFSFDVFSTFLVL